MDYDSISQIQNILMFGNYFFKSKDLQIELGYQYINSLKSNIIMKLPEMIVHLVYRGQILKLILLLEVQLWQILIDKLLF